MGNKTWTEPGLGRGATRAAKRQAVLMAGARLFLDRGYEQTSLDDIAAALNITKRTIYYYVQSKEDILHACHMQGLEFLKETLARSADPAQPLVDRIAGLVRGYAAWISTDLGGCLITARENSLSEDRREALRSAKARVDHQLRALLAEGVASGAIRPCDPRLVAAAVFGALNWLPSWNRGAAPVPQDRIADQYLDLFLNGLLPRDP